MHHAFRIDEKAMSSGEAMKLRKLTTLSTAIVRQEATFTETMQRPLSYARTFEEVYVSHFVFVCIMDIFNDIMSSNFLAANCRATYVRYSLYQSQKDDEKTKRRSSSA